MNRLLPRRPRLFLATLGIALLAYTGAPMLGFHGAIVRAADPSADIPGLELPGTVAAGRLGGAIYDVVYHFSVQPGFVIVASLTGAVGTDFDLYLFDDSATTVVSDAGLLKKSAGPTSTESISWPSRLGGLYYIDLNGATDVEGDYRLTVQAVPDPTPPAVSMAIAPGHSPTNQLTVPLSLIATDDLSGVVEMAFSGDGVTFGGWEPFEPTTTWTFSPGDGPRPLWVKVKNGVGLESKAAEAVVVIDTAAPAVTSISPPPGSNVVGLRPVFRVAFNEPLDPASWNDLGLVVQSAAGDLVPGTYVYSAAERAGRFTPANPLTPGLAYVVALGAVMDAAGNLVTPRPSWSVTPLAPTSLQVTTTSSVLALGGTTRLSVLLIGAPAPATATVLARSGADPDFVPITTLAIVDGRATLTEAPERNTTYRIRYQGAFGVAVAQVDVPILVRRSVRLVGRSATLVAQAKVGARVSLVAATQPAASGLTVSFKLYRFDIGRHRWVYAGSHGRSTDAAGRAAYTWTPSASGSYYWRASVASTVDFANNITPAYRWFVIR